MHLLIVAATPFEIAPLKEYLVLEFEQTGTDRYRKGPLEISLLVTGVGQVHTSYALTNFLGRYGVDLAINAGVAGAINQKLKIGEVVQVVQEEFGDLGVEEADGSFRDIHELGLIEKNAPPFREGKLLNQAAGSFDFLPKVSGITVNKVHGSAASVEALKKKYRADIESMEGAAFFYVCMMEDVPFLQLRAISNYVEARNKDNWDLPAAINQLNKTLIDITDLFTGKKRP